MSGGAELLDVAVEAARAAGAVLLEHQAAGAREIETKSSPTDMVSAADVAAEAAIRDVLERRRPDDAILGEEGADRPGTSGVRWVVDPLDGTTNFLFGLPQWCVSIACEDHVAAILDPVRDELFTVRAGEPALLDGRALGPPRARELATALVATGFGYEQRVRAAQARVAARVIPRVRDIRRLGSAALDLAWAAAGRVDAYYEHGVQVWDTAAGLMLCRAAGLELRELDGGGDLPPGVLAAPPAIIDGLAELL